MLRRLALGIGGIVGLAIAISLAASNAFADAYGDLLKVQTAFRNAKSYHVDEHFSNGKTVTVDYLAPDRWRMQPSPDVTELVLGNNIYMVRNGRTTKMPFGGMMVRKMIEHAEFTAPSKEIQETVQDLGMQKLDGRSVHAYKYVNHGTPVTLYVGRDWLPIKMIVEDKKVTATNDYSKYNEPISIEEP